MDTSALASCATYSGSIAIAMGVTGDFTLNGIQEIQDSLTAKNVTQITGLSSSSLMKIGDTFNLKNVIILSTLCGPP